MKELYTTPEAEILCFAPVENLALNDLFTTYGYSGSTGSGDSNDSITETPLPTTEPK